MGATSFNIPASGIVVGANTLSFAGKSSENGLALTPPQPRTFIREAKPFLKDTPVTFMYDEDSNTLKIDFTLSRPLPTRWQFKGAGGLGRDVQVKDAAQQLYQAQIDLRIAEFKGAAESKLADVAGSLLKVAPVELEIVNRSNPSEVIASFAINFIKPKETVIEKVKKAGEFAVGGHTDNAKKLIAEALGYIGSLNSEQKAVVDASIPTLKQQGDTKSKVFKVLGIAGKVAAGMFGIPLPF
ncbi:MAG: hypothetical protein LC795_08350 [Acidobacteria bacterium]|nr:hypothetical protein [Acidobacteriota bacterium]